VSTKKARDLLWFQLHSWIGLKLSVLLSFVLFTGTMAVFSHELDWLLNPPMRAAEVFEGEVAWGTAYDELREHYPGARLLTLTRHEDPWHAVQALVETPWGQLGRLWFDPESGAYQGVTSWRNVQRFFRTTHRHLMLPTKIGIPIVASLAFPLLLSLIAGLFVYKGFWHGFFRWPRFHRQTRIWAGDLHRLLGLWSSWFVLLIIVTSIWYFVEVLGGRAPRFPTPNMSVSSSEGGSVTRAKKNAVISGDDLDAWIAEARAVYPGLRVRRVNFPTEAGSPVTIMGDLDAVLVRPRANTVSLDPATGAVVGAYRGEELGVHIRISEAADPLHFGYFGGLWTKSLWFLFGAAMTALSVTGCVIYGKRVSQSLRRSGASGNASASAGLPS